MRGPDRGSDYRRRLLLETIRGHALSGHRIGRRLRAYQQGAETRLPSRWDSRGSERWHAAPERAVRN